MSFASGLRRRPSALPAKVASLQPGQHSLWRRLLLGLTLIGISSAAPADAIDDYMQAQLARYNTPGLALGIVKNGEIVRTQGYGFANLEHSSPMRADSVFQSASTGKMFTAVAAMLLVEDGKLRLDESIRTYLPDAPATWQPITLRLMLNHISGLDRNLDAAEPRTDYTTEQLLQLYYQTQLKYAPAERFLYSNIGYELVGLVVEKVSGERSYVDLLKKRVFDPLGMTSARAIDLRAVIAHRAAGYQPGPGGELLNQEFESESLSAQGSSGLYLSAQDYARWEVGVRNRKILSEASWQEIFRPATLASGRSYPYGFGWFLESPRQQVRYHSGSHLGFGSYYSRFLGPQLAIIVLANRSGVNREEIVRHLAGMIDPTLVPAPARPIKDSAPAVTKRLRRMLEPQEIPSSELGAFAMSDRPYRISVYSKARASLGALQELRLFAIDQVGDERVHIYRARFTGGIADVNLALGTDDRIQALGLSATERWDAPL